ncbi:hypothetical protein ACLOJK_002278 [Asimina triloba]
MIHSYRELRFVGGHPPSMALELLGAVGVGASPKTTLGLQEAVGVLGANGKVVSGFQNNSEAGVIHLIQSIISKQEVEDPFYVLDLAAVASLMDRWAHALPHVRPFYAVKCNPEPSLLSALASLGASFDCASRAEIEAVLAIGASTDQIIYANPCKAEAQIKYAARAGVGLTTFDSADEIEKLRRWHPSCAVLLRLKAPEDSGARCPLGPKYGALPEEVVPLLQAARAAGVVVAGVSFHIGSGATHVGAYRGAIAAAREVFEAAERLGMPRLRVLNIGGGFTAGPQFEEAAAAIKGAVEEQFADEAGLTAFTLATNIIGRRVRGEVREYWINDGVYGSMNCILYDHATVTAVPLACASNRANPTCRGLKTYASTVFGPTCDALDTVLVGHQLPDLLVNDWLVFPNMGAYTVAAGSNFNGFATSTIRTHLACSTTR